MAKKKERLYPITHGNLLIVRTHMWKNPPNREYLTKEGKRVWFTKLEDAREYAAENGFKGIHVEYE